MRKGREGGNLVCIFKEVIMQHLTLEQRSQIEELKSSGLSLRHIGEIVGVHASTVSRELRRNRIRGRYNYVIADCM